jgi:hypothetical protein
VEDHSSRPAWYIARPYFKKKKKSNKKTCPSHFESMIYIISIDFWGASFIAKTTSNWLEVSYFSFWRQFVTVA